MYNSNALAMPAPPPAPKRPVSKEDDNNRGEISCINIEFTENGSDVRVSFEPKKINPKMDRYAQMPEDEKMSFESTTSAKAYVNKMIDQHGGEESAEGAMPMGADENY